MLLCSVCCVHVHHVHVHIHVYRSAQPHNQTTNTLRHRERRRPPWPVRGRQGEGWWLETQGRVGRIQGGQQNVRKYPNHLMQNTLTNTINLHPYPQEISLVWAPMGITQTTPPLAALPRSPARRLPPSLPPVPVTLNNW